VDNILEFGISMALRVADKDSSILLEARSGKIFIGTSTAANKLILESKYDGNDFRAIISSEIARDTQSMFLGEFSVHDDFIEFKNQSKKTKIALTKSNISLIDLARGYEKNNNALFNASELKTSFLYTRHASNDKTIGDIVLRGFHFTLNHDHAEIMASNGAMLSLVKVNQNNLEFNSNQVLILNPDFFNLIKTFQDDGDIHLGFNEMAVSMMQTSEYFTLRAVSSLISGKNPLPYERVVETARKGVKSLYVVNKKSFLDSVKDVKVFSSESKATLTLFNTGEFEISTEGSKGQATRQVDVSTHKNPNDENINLKVNIEYLFNYLNGNKTELISVGVADSLSPIFFEDSYGIEVLAPLRN
jgi:DNA polymerase III sliding clamp (beta) subunit (PCNA family)